MSKKMKHVTVGMLAFCLAIAGFFLQGVLSTKASTDTVHETCSPYVEEMEVNGYRTNGFTAPPSTKDGYVFSGWYTDEDCKTPLSSGVESGMAYARFVPSHILSVKAQISANLLNSDASDDDTAAIRFITTVDSLQYHEIGFDITIGEKTVRKSSNQVYDSLYAIGKSDGEVLKYTPQENFCSLSTYFKTWAFINVPSSAYGTEITVQPFWITLDGTTVYGESGVKTVQQGIDSYFSNTADTSWYDESKTDFTLYTPQELYGFAELVNKQSVTFAEKTVRLGADIALNVGNAEDWEETAPENKWPLINGFKGTLDGQGNTISGIYVHSTATYTGLFGTITDGTVVENLKLVNSYIEGACTTATGNRAGVGSIAGRNSGIIQNVYSEAIVKNSAQMTGGIVGMISVVGENPNKISNCWFDGQINAVGSSGGILGGVYAQEATIDHCLNTGTLNISSGGMVGGLCGYPQNTANVTIHDSLNAGSINAGTGVTQIGSAVGGVSSTAIVTMTDTYGITEFSEKLIAVTGGTQEISSSEAKALSDITGSAAYLNTTLDFNNNWALRNADVPALKAFDEGDLDVSWYDAAATEFTITTSKQLYGFADLVANAKVTFENSVVKLGADIVLNAGNAEDWLETAPESAWAPVNGFKGTFNGQGHTISGMYINSTNVYTGMFGTLEGIVKNLKIDNSYIEGNGANNYSGTGSVAGQVKGTIDTVYSEAIVKNGKQMTGGIAGMVNGTTDNKITNCWFNGTIYATKNSGGGILGGMYGGSAMIEHCLNTGILYVVNSGTTALQQFGGLSGYVRNGGSLTLNDSLNVGKVEVKEGTVGGQVGAIGAGCDGTSTITADNVYGVDSFATKNFGHTANGATIITMDGAECKYVSLEAITGEAALDTKLDFTNFWAIRDGETPMLQSFHWYYADSNAGEFTIGTPQELFEFNALCKNGITFEDKTVKLGADITLNAGNAEDWMETAPESVWMPVSGFKGTFNGQGHTISGMYVNTTGVNNTGMFGTLNAGATVTNLKIVNSYFEGNGTNTRAGVGSVAGYVAGTIDTVYSEAIVKNGKRMAGGIAGMVNGATDSKITNCWFNGTIYATQNSSGSILGGMYGGSVLIEHCLNTGTLYIVNSGTGNLQQFGGLCGYVENNGSLILNDSLNAGSYEVKAGTVGGQVGTIGAGCASGCTITADNVYGIDSFIKKNFGYTGGTITTTDGAECKYVSLEEITGETASDTKLDFTNSWITRPGTIPMLKVFADMQ